MPTLIIFQAQVPHTTCRKSLLSGTPGLSKMASILDANADNGSNLINFKIQQAYVRTCLQLGGPSCSDDQRWC